MSDSSEPVPLSQPRLQEARRLGYTPRSPELTWGGVLLAGSWIGYSSIPRLIVACQDLVRENLHWNAHSPVLAVGHSLQTAGLEAFRILVASWLTAVVLDMLQIGFVWSPVTWLPHEERLNPVSGVLRLFGWPTWERATLLTLKLGITLIAVLAMCGLSLNQYRATSSVTPIPASVHWICLTAAMVGGLLFFSGLTDAWVRQHRWRTSLEQSEDERRRK